MAYDHQEMTMLQYNMILLHDLSEGKEMNGIIACNRLSILETILYYQVLIFTITGLLEDMYLVCYVLTCYH